MNNNHRLGCFTGVGIIATLITLFVVVGFAFASGGQMFSPGALNAQPGETYGGVSSHAQITECETCHAVPFGVETMADRCAACHTDIAAQMKDVAKFHGAIMQKSSVLACRDCHPDHRGASASLTDMGNFTFPHQTLGFSLKGHQRTASGAAFSCQDCHQEDITKFAPETCENCHRQVDDRFTQTHVAAFGTDCLACHDGVDRFGGDFSHASFDFQLQGKHAGVTCEKCHGNARTVADMKSTPQDCFSCHQKDDRHKGQFGQDCGSCHTSQGWQGATFNHNFSTFKLEGSHAKVACEQCHVNNVFKGTPTDCFSCHQKNDEHKGQFGTDCASCHTTKGWDGATFDHSRSSFPLTGAHAQVRCEDCHKNAVFKGTPSTCVSCHAEPKEHAGQFGTDCAACHTSNAWSPAAFNGEHAFPLNHGEQGTVSCATCHPAGYKTYSCYGCHEHTEAEIASKHREENIPNFENCMECHADGRKNEGGGD